MYYIHLNVNSFSPKIEDIRHLAKLANTFVVDRPPGKSEFVNCVHQISSQFSTLNQLGLDLALPDHDLILQSKNITTAHKHNELLA